jgi:hypothetical protein
MAAASAWWSATVWSRPQLHLSISGRSASKGEKNSDMAHLEKEVDASRYASHGPVWASPMPAPSFRSADDYGV